MDDAPDGRRFTQGSQFAAPEVQIKKAFAFGSPPLVHEIGESGVGGVFPGRGDGQTQAWQDPGRHAVIVFRFQEEDVV